MVSAPSAPKTVCALVALSSAVPGRSMRALDDIVMLHASFITAEDRPDLVIGFGLEPSGSESLILLRSPQHEHLLDDAERGVTVSYTADETADEHFLFSIDWSKSTVRIETTRWTYNLDISGVEDAEIAEAKRILALMNADGRFRCNVV